MQTLPLPSTFAGFAKLTKAQWIQLLPLITTVLFILVLSTSLFTPTPAPKAKKARINNKIKLDSAKVVDSKTIKDIEELGKDTVAFCRCWKSTTFPYCDGSHAKHNEECGDNCG